MRNSGYTGEQDSPGNGRRAGHPAGERAPRTHLSSATSGGWSWDDLAVGAMWTVFAAQLVVFALRIDPSIPPDEATHLGRCLAFAATLWLPEDSTDTYALGLLGHRPYLHYWLMGKLVAINPTPLSEQLLLRLANALFGLATVVYADRWIRLVSPLPAARVLLAACLTGTLMFAGVSASVSYDNSANAFAAASIFYLFSYTRSHEMGALCGFLICVAAGCLTKQAFLPLAAILLVVLGWRERRSWREAFGSLRGAFESMGLRSMLGLGTAAVLIVLTVVLYGGNLLRWQRTVPDPADVIGLEASLQFPIALRNHILDGYREGKVEYRVALRMARRIPRAEDRETTIALLDYSREIGSERMSPPMYAITWMWVMAHRTFGYFGHRTLYRSDAAIAAYLGLFAVVFGLSWLGWRRPEAADLHWAALIGFGYATALLAFHHYPSYLRTGLPELAVQGRYLFPVLAPLYGWFAISLLEPLPRRAQPFVAGVVGAIFLFGGLPFFLLAAPASWLVGAP